MIRRHLVLFIAGTVLPEGVTGIQADEPLF
jgi:hypothetical protein